eukprot:CAMPEP_0172821994 /NCGR_PEP_ID=MMETSP1075-20121228/16375_1 /TAXON_ID=2916 /ORGANISM="Ceratium fusus, Strain PA161109" /LENGTH=71 /DNA_ID=CAMNT_0013662935 /DNA_START=26 /DNA_END=238 /DNA_ORIENTATION=+
MKLDQRKIAQQADTELPKKSETELAPGITRAQTPKRDQARKRLLPSSGSLKALAAQPQRSSKRQCWHAMML